MTWISLLQKFTFVPNQRLNFLCGENGSGKSAVLTAIVFALGGTARMANRGTSNKGFIRTNQTSATVEITLANLGENHYRPGTTSLRKPVCFFLCCAFPCFGSAINDMYESGSRLSVINNGTGT